LYLILPQVSKAAAGDQFWDPEFAIVGTTNSNIALAVNNGTIVAGGFGTPSTNAALMQWDGHQWSALGVFNSASSAFIYDAAYVGGTLYVGGIFSSVNGVAANGLARWNGSAWSAVGFTGEALTFAVSGGNLYVGGFFNMLDSASVTMTNIGLWRRPRPGVVRFRPVPRPQRRHALCRRLLYEFRQRHRIQYRGVERRDVDGGRRRRWRRTHRHCGQRRKSLRGGQFHASRFHRGK
jgi:hypothetical protein